MDGPTDVQRQASSLEAPCRSRASFFFWLVPFHPLIILVFASPRSPLWPTFGASFGFSFNKLCALPCLACIAAFGAIPPPPPFLFSSPSLFGPAPPACHARHAEQCLPRTERASAGTCARQIMHSCAASRDVANITYAVSQRGAVPARRAVRVRPGSLQWAAGAAGAGEPKSRGRRAYYLQVEEAFSLSRGSRGPTFPPSKPPALEATRSCKPGRAIRPERGRWTGPLSSRNPPASSGAARCTLSCGGRQPRFELSVGVGCWLT